MSRICQTSPRNVSLRLCFVSEVHNTRQMSLSVLQADCKRAVASLSNLSNDELSTIIDDDVKIADILKQLDQCYLKEVENDKETLMASNNSLAEFNLAKEPELVEGRERLEERSKEGEELSKRVKELSEELRKKTGDMSLETALALLQTAASEVEEESETIAKKFLDNDMDLDEFLDQFQAKRKLMHLRLVKAEKLSKILQRDPTLSNIPNYINAPPVNINSSYFPGIPMNPPTGMVPYPTGPLNMPMPPGGSYFQNHY